MRKKCLLIGGAGFIGARLAGQLAACDYEVTVCDCIDKEKIMPNIAGNKYLQLNYFDTPIDDAVISEQDFIVLLISSVNPQNSMQEPEECYDRDITRMIQLLEQMRKCGVKQLAFISSGGTVYGNQQSEMLREDAPTFPINHYGIMKLTQEKILIMYNQLFGMENIIFRLANPYGQGQRIASGVGMVTAALHKILTGEKIKIYGKGEVVRDYIYIDDAVQMMQKLLDQRLLDYSTSVFNVGTGHGTSIKEVIGIAEKILGKKAEIEFVPERGIDVQRNVLDISKIKKAIGGYQCRSLEEGIKQYYNILKQTGEA